MLTVSISCPKCGGTVVFSLKPNQSGGKCGTCYQCKKQVCINYNTANNELRILSVR